MFQHFKTMRQCEMTSCLLEQHRTIADCCQRDPRRQADRLRCGDTCKVRLRCGILQPQGVRSGRERGGSPRQAPNETAARRFAQTSLPRSEGNSMAAQFCRATACSPPGGKYLPACSRRDSRAAARSRLCRLVAASARGAGGGRVEHLTAPRFAMRCGSSCLSRHQTRPKSKDRGDA
jgi:hypothetical protein